MPYGHGYYDRKDYEGRAVATYADLPTSGLSDGEIWIVEADEAEYMWTSNGGSVVKSCADANIAANEVNIVAYAWPVATPVVYTCSGGAVVTKIPQLTIGNTYYILAGADADHFKVEATIGGGFIAIVAPAGGSTHIFTQVVEGWEKIGSTSSASSLTVTSIITSATPTPNINTTFQYEITALASGATFGAPTGTPYDGQKLIIRIKDNGGAQVLAWNAIYRGGTMTALPLITTISKTMYCGFSYNSADATWDLIAYMDGI
jgi:hypothetical protein